MSNTLFEYKNDTYSLSVEGMTCAHCMATVENAALSVDGVFQAKVLLSEARAKISGGKSHEVIKAINAAGYSAKHLPRTAGSCEVDNVAELPEAPFSKNPATGYEIKVDDMSCASCVATVEKAIQAVDGVSHAQVNLIAKSAHVVGGEPQNVVKAVIDHGYNASLPVAVQRYANEIEPYQLNIAGMTCSACVAKVEKSIGAVPGVMEALVNLLEKKALVSGGDPQAVINAIIDSGYDASFNEVLTPEDRLLLNFRDRQSNAMESLLGELGSELEFKGNAEGGAVVSLKTRHHPARLLLKLKQAGFLAELEEQFEDPHFAQAESARFEIRLAWQRAALAAAVGIGLMAGEMTGVFPALMPGSGQLFWGLMAFISLFTMWFSGRNYYRTAIKQAKHLSSNMDTLVALGTAAAWLSSVIIILNPAFVPGGGNHLYLDASVMILAFLQFGHALETRARSVTSEAIGALVQLAPKFAAVIVDDEEIRIPVSLLRKGDSVRIKPGETVPIDGEVIHGVSSVDESMLTGESLAVSKQPGDEVIGGTGNNNGSLRITVTRLGEETTLSHIVSMVKQAQLSKPPIANLVDRVSSVFVPTVIVISILTFITWWLFGPPPQLAFAFTTGIAVLVIACPCALGLATPIAIMVGTGRAAQLGILIRNSDALQSAAHLTHLVVDKTGTLTEGKPAITQIKCSDTLDERGLLQLALSLEIGSAHPLAQAVLHSAREQNIEAIACENFQSITGMGVSAEIQQQCYYLGNEKLMREQGLEMVSEWSESALEQAKRGATPIWLGSSEKLLGLLLIEDKLRDDSADAIDALHGLGIQIVMCTGDFYKTANAVGQALGIDTVHSELLPEQKLHIINDLQSKGYKVGMVGDGVNDAPALAQAHTGFAIGSGTDVAIEHADITLVGDSISSVSTAIAISSATMRNIKQNLFGAFIYNVIGIPLAAGLFFPLTGWLLNPMFASFAMAMSSVTVVSNANRLRFFKRGN